MTDTTQTDPSMPAPATPGYKTLHFYGALAVTAISALVVSGAGLGAAASAIAMVLGGLTSLGYSAVRTIAKSGDPAKPAYKTTEFWLACASAFMSLLYAAGVISDGSHVAIVAGAISALLSTAGYSVTKG